MSIDIQLDPGTYTFYGTAITTTSETYTDQQPLTLSAGSHVNITFNFQLNAEPTIEVSGDTSVYKGESADIKVTASDQDDVDTLTVTVVSAGGGGFLRSAPGNNLVTVTPSYSWNAPDSKGNHTLKFQVTDGHGGMAEASHNIESVNRAPTVEITADPDSVSVEDDVEFSCSGSDEDSSDDGSLDLQFSGGPTSGGTGGTITETYTTDSDDESSFTATCKATDSDGDTGSASVTVSVNSALATFAGTLPYGQCYTIGADEWQIPVESGVDYVVECTFTYGTEGDVIQIYQKKAVDGGNNNYFFAGSWSGPSGIINWSESATGNAIFHLHPSGNQTGMSYSCVFTGTQPSSMPSSPTIDDGAVYSCG